MKLLFLDSNILLNFYDFHDEDLDQLNKLADLIDQGEIKLFFTTQVLHEVRKNRDYRLSDSYKKFSDHKAEVPMPVFCKSYEEYADIKRTQKILADLKLKLSKKISTDIQSRQLKADTTIELLVEKSEIIASDKYLELAIKRHRLGRPPGKKDKSYGDEINWESLLSEVEREGDFIIVSEDGDYSSAVDEHALKDYLVDEWEEKKGNNIYFYRSLGTFFAEHDIKIEFKVEQEKDTLIQDLINSSNFLTTHGIISKLNKYGTFTDGQLGGLVTALLENEQVNWIASDQDVGEFYKRYLTDKSDKFDAETWGKIQTYIWPQKEDGNIKKELDELEAKSIALESEEELDPRDIPF
jgi:hypothetical protein